MKQEIRNIEDIINKKYPGEDTELFTLNNQEKSFIILAQKKENNSYCYYEVETTEDVKLKPITDIFLYIEEKNIELNWNNNFIRTRNNK